MFEDKLIQPPPSCEPATTIRTRSETDSSVSMGGRNIARVAARNISVERCFHHRNACHCYACCISGAFDACQRQGWDLKQIYKTRADEARRMRRTSPSDGATGQDRLIAVRADNPGWGMSGIFKSQEQKSNEKFWKSEIGRRLTAHNEKFFGRGKIWEGFRPEVREKVCVGLLEQIILV